MNERGALPFLRWVGGKRWLAHGWPELFPDQFNRYIEPFLGSGAIFFRLKPARAILSDVNKELIDTYRAIKENPKLVRRYLAVHQLHHCTAYYYRVRSQSPRSKFAHAAKFIYLNRTCWNGLYRVNLRGQFNVPKGTYTKVLLPTDDFPQTSKQLRRAKLLCSDFQQVIDEADDGDFIFADPPYTVKQNLNGFIKYNDAIFSWEDQLALRDCLAQANKRGAKILMTNANHRSIRNLYRDVFDIETVSRYSILAASAEKRTNTTELLLYNY